VADCRRSQLPESRHLNGRFREKQTLSLGGKQGSEIIDRSGLVARDVDDHGRMVRESGFSNNVVVANRFYSYIQF